MYHGTSASAGIGIGKVAIVEDVQLVIKKEGVADPKAEAERFKQALEQSLQETPIFNSIMALVDPGDDCFCP